MTARHNSETVKTSENFKAYLGDSTCQSSRDLLTDAGCQRCGRRCQFTDNSLQS